MRKNLILFLIITSSFIFMALQCSKDEVDEVIDPCKETALSSSIDVPYVFSANIYYEDSVPYEGDVHFKVHKTYCDGTVSGEYYLTHIQSNSNGGWFSGMSYTYTYGNYDDIVWATFTFESPSYDIHKDLNAFSYGYVQMYYNSWDPLQPTINIYLPWKSTESKN